MLQSTLDALADTLKRHHEEVGPESTKLRVRIMMLDIANALDEDEGLRIYDRGKFLQRCGHPQWLGGHFRADAFHPSPDLRRLLDAEVCLDPTLTQLLNYLDNADDAACVRVFGGDAEHALQRRALVIGELDGLIESYGKSYLP